MTLSPLGKYALRSLTRHSRRTLLSVLGIGIGCAVALIATAYIRGEGDLIERAAALSGTGHLRVSPAGWLPQRDDRLRLRDWQQALAIARQTPGVAAATPRARSNGLLAFGTRVAGVEIVGVDPATEPRLNRVVRSIGAGRYLRPDDRGATVIGQGVADRLRVRLDDELLVTVAARDGNLQSAILRIVGIVRTGSQTVDATVCQIRLPELEALTGRPGAAEVAVLLERSEEMPAVQAALQKALPAGNVVHTWIEVLPELKASFDLDQGFTRLLIGTIILVVLLGITSAQLASVLERRREFAVLSALGMKELSIARLLLLEAGALGLLGAVTGLLLGVPVVYYLATVGIDYGAFVDADLAISNVLIDKVFHADMGFWLVPQALAIALGATLVATVYPVWFAAKTDPASALRVAQ